MALILSLLLSVAVIQELRAEDRSASPATREESSRICAANKTAHLLIWNSAAKGSAPIYQLGLCDSVRGEGFKLRAISRKELSDAFVQSRDELKAQFEPARMNKQDSAKPTPEEFWSALGVGKEQLTPTDKDQKIAGQVLVFPHTEDLKSLQRAAEWLKQSQNILSDTAVLSEASNDAVLMDWFQAFESLCRTAGGKWTEKREVDIAGGIVLDNQTLLDRALQAEKDSLQGKPVCQCRNLAFSNPVDYRCRLAKKGKIFEEAIEPAPMVSEQSTSGTSATSSQDSPADSLPAIPHRAGGNYKLRRSNIRR